MGAENGIVDFDGLDFGHGVFDSRFAAAYGEREVVWGRAEVAEHLNSQRSSTQGKHVSFTWPALKDHPPSPAECSPTKLHGWLQSCKPTSDRPLV